MEENFKKYTQDNIIKFSTSSAVMLLILHTVLVIFMQGKLPPYIPFFNSMPWGATRLVLSRYVLLLPFFLCIFFLVNTFLGVLVYKKNTLAARVLSFNSLLFLSLSIIAYSGILLLTF